MTNKERSAKLLAAIKKELSARQKSNKEADGKRRCYQSLSVEWDEGFNGKDAFIEVRRFYSAKAPFRIAKMTESDLENVFRELIRLLDGLKAVRGWGGLYYVHPGQRYSTSLIRDRIQAVGIADAPCAEFKSLQNYVNKFGTGAKIETFDLYGVGMGGKKGYIWDEEGERAYLDNEPRRCKRILEELRAARSSKDTMTCRRRRENYIDPLEEEYSSREEIECSGEHREYIEIKITTPTGRVKYDEKIY